MEIITTRGLILEVADHWEKQYGKGKYGQDKIETLKALRSLDLTVATAEQVNELIGNSSWTALRCNECGKMTDCVIQLGEEPDYESRTAQICADCVAKAAGLMLVKS